MKYTRKIILKTLFLSCVLATVVLFFLLRNNEKSHTNATTPNSSFISRLSHYFETCSKWNIITVIFDFNNNTKACKEEEIVIFNKTFTRSLLCTMNSEQLVHLNHVKNNDKSLFVINNEEITPESVFQHDYFSKRVNNINQFLPLGKTCHKKRVTFISQVALSFKDILNLIFCTDYINEMVLLHQNYKSKRSLEHNDMLSVVVKLYQGVTLNQKELVMDLLQKNALNLNYPVFGGTTILNTAVMKGQPEMVSLLLKAGADPRAIDFHDDTAIHKAVRFSKYDILEQLIKENKTLLNVKNRLGSTALHYACLQHRGDIVELLLNLGADPNVQDIQGYTVLHMAAHFSDISIVKAIISSNMTDLNIQNIDGDTPLHIAAKQDENEVSILLIENEAVTCIPNELKMTIFHLYAAIGQVNLTQLALSKSKCGIDSKDIDGASPLSVAVQYHNSEICEILVKNGANPDDINFLERTPLHYAALLGNKFVTQLILSKSTKSINYLDMKGMTPLYLSLNHPEVLVILLEYGANPTIAGSRKYTVFHEAASVGQLKTLKLLINKFEKHINIQDMQGITPLFPAIINNHTEVVKFLLDHGANPLLDDFTESGLLLPAASNIFEITLMLYNVLEKLLNPNELINYINKQNIFSRTALAEAAQSGNEEVFLFLSDHGGDLKFQNIDENNLLHFAAAGNSFKIINYILNNTGFSIDSKSEKGFTPLMVAAHMGFQDKFDFFLEQGATLKVITVQGETVLHAAAYGGNIDIIYKVLNETTIDIDTIDSEGFTPLMEASEKGHVEAVELLLERNADPLAKNVYQEDSIAIAGMKGSIKVLFQFQKYIYNYDFLLGIALNNLDQNEYLIKYFIQMSSIADDPIYHAAAMGSHIGLTEALSVMKSPKMRKFPNIMREFFKEYNFLLEGLTSEDTIDQELQEGYLSPVDISLLFFGDAKTLKLLLEKLHINIIQLNRRKRTWTPIDFAMFCAMRTYKSYEISKTNVYYLLKLDKHIPNYKNDIGWTVMHKAAWFGFREIFPMLQKIDMHQTDFFGRTPLHIAASKGFRFVVDQIFRSSNKSVNTKDIFGFTPLHLAVIYSKRKFFERLSMAMSDMTPSNRYTFIEVNRGDLSSNSQNYFNTMLSILEQNADINERDSAFGWTPLHWAATNGDTFKAVFLVTRGAAINIPSRSAHTPMYLARHWGRKEIYNYLQSQGGVW